MRRLLLGILTASMMMLAACGDDDDAIAIGDDETPADEFCARFEAQPTPAAGALDETSVGEMLTFFVTLEDAAPEEIADELATLTDELEALTDAMAEYQGMDGQQAIEAAQQAGDVDVTAIAESATAVEDYADEHCADLRTTNG